jgi:hypothetical protein
MHDFIIGDDEIGMAAFSKMPFHNLQMDRQSVKHFPGVFLCTWAKWLSRFDFVLKSFPVIA